MHEIRVVSDSANLTKKIGAKFMSLAVKRKDKKPIVVFLKGDVGAGKTTFTIGALSFFGIRPHAASPTFVLMKRYAVKKNKENIREIFHIDAYRLRSKKDFRDVLGSNFDSDTENDIARNAMFFVEWPERVNLRPPKGSYVVDFGHGILYNERSIKISKI